MKKLKFKIYLLGNYFLLFWNRMYFWSRKILLIKQWQVDAVVVQLRSRVWLFATPWTAARQAPLSSTLSQSLLKLTPTESVMLSNHLILCRSLLLSPLVVGSIRVFCNDTVEHHNNSSWRDIDLYSHFINKISYNMKKNETIHLLCCGPHLFYWTLWDSTGVSIGVYRFIHSDLLLVNWNWMGL